MTEAWFYRDGPAEPERGPVTASDLDYLRSTGRLTPGMEIRTQHGDWQQVSQKGSVTSRRCEIPVSKRSERVSAATQTNTDSIGTAVGPPLVRPEPPVPPVRAQEKGRPWLLPAVVGVVVVALLLVLLLSLSWQKDGGTGLASSGSENASKDGDGEEQADGSGDTQASGKSEQISSTKQSLATANPEKPTTPADTQQPDSGKQGPGGTGVGPDEDNQPELDIADKTSPAAKARTYFISPGAEFFGIRSAGNRFVFLIDSSGSMAGSRDAAARKELIESVRKMDLDMKLEVMFFTDTLKPVFGKYRKVDDADEVVKRIQATRPLMGGTPVMEGIRRALKMQPDAIFLLTDGSFNEGDVTNNVKAINKNGIPINTIGFHLDGSEAVLRSIARTSGGDYRYVAP